MRIIVSIVVASLVTACSAPSAGPEPSLAPRAAEAIDPRIPIPAEVPAGPADQALASQLADLVAQARSGIAAFEARRSNADRLAANAGPMASESWVAAQQALSLLVEQYGVTTQVAANIDELGASRLESQRWIRPADQKAISSAAAEVAAIGDAQAGAIDRLKEQLAN